MILLIPVFVYLCYDVFKPVIETEITADGMLGYLGAVIGSLVALAIAIISVCREIKREEKDEEEKLVRRRQEIKPNLQVELESTDEGYFNFIISNDSEHRAMFIYLIDRNVLPFVAKGEPKAIKVCFDFSVNIQDGYYFECEMEQGYPKYFWLIYNDIDWNTISQKFEHKFEDGKHFYISREIGYEG